MIEEVVVRWGGLTIGVLLLAESVPTECLFRVWSEIHPTRQVK